MQYWARKVTTILISFSCVVNRLILSKIKTIIFVNCLSEIMFGAFGIMIKKWIVSKPNSVTKYQFLITEIKEWKKIVDFFGELQCHFYWFLRGRILEWDSTSQVTNPLSDSRGGWVERDRYIVWYWLSRCGIWCTCSQRWIITCLVTPRDLVPVLECAF